MTPLVVTTRQRCPSSSQVASSTSSPQRMLGRRPWSRATSRRYCWISGWGEKARDQFGFGANDSEYRWGGDVAGAAGWRCCPPGAPDLRGLLQREDVPLPGQMQASEGGKTSEAGADDQHLDLRGHHPGLRHAQSSWQKANTIIVIYHALAEHVPTRRAVLRSFCPASIGTHGPDPQNPSHSGAGRSRGTVNRILDAAEAIAAEDGPEAVTTRAIAEHAGVAAPSIYRFFADRDEIFDGRFWHEG